MKKKWEQFAAFFLGCALLVGLDQWTKALASAHLKGAPPIVILDDIFELTYLENRGAAFGLLQGQQAVFLAIAIAVMAAAVYGVWRMPPERKYIPLYLCAVGLVSGAAGNMIDRLAQGYVVDFLYFCLIDFPVFNVADCYVTLSAAVLALTILFYYRDQDLEPFSLRRQKGEIR